MTNEEAIFCEKSYLGETNCQDCKYYGTDICKSRESHKMAIKALEQQDPCNDCISRQADVREDDIDIAIRALEQELDRDCERYSRAYGTLGCCTTVSQTESEDDEDNEVFDMAIEALEQQEPCEDPGEISDGYHTFNQLYYQRAVLFATIVNLNKDKAWKSFKHSDGKYCFDSNGEWFIVGVDTPQGSYTYHYEKKY